MIDAKTLADTLVDSESLTLIESEELLEALGEVDPLRLKEFKTLGDTVDEGETVALIEDETLGD